MEEYYTIIDLQGGNLMSKCKFKTLIEVRDHLRNFHSVDVELTEKMDLSDLLEIGLWDIVRHIKPKNV